MSANTPNPPNLKDAPWLLSSSTQRVLKALDDAGHQGRIVGGAVRNSLLGVPVNDIDIATTARPDETLRAAQAAGLKAVATGAAHGTITVVAEDTPFEVTTLRRDVETDGRHAKVAFTDDWAGDAARRDFTINALYCDKTGTLFDPVGGLDDIQSRRIRFIGDAHQRIEEDYLRILRFFRFTATYGDGRVDPEGLAACAKRISGVDRLSGERIWAEMKKLFIAEHVGDVIDAVDDIKLLTQLFEPTSNVNRLQQMLAIDTALNEAGDPVQRLAALVLKSVDDAVWLRTRLKLPTRAFDRLALMAKSRTALKIPPTIAAGQAYIYHHGVVAFQDHIKLAWASALVPEGDAAWQALYHLPTRWQAPEFPLSGADIVALGVTPGPRVGEILAKVEGWWIDQGFTNDMQALHQCLADAVKVTKA